MANEIIKDALKAQIVQFAYDAICQVGDGVELVDVLFYKQYGKLNVEVLIWKKSGISLDDCEMVHNVISGMLDGLEDEFDDDYILNVSSQGLDRKIVTDDDFRRALDTEIECIDDKKKKHHGTLVSYDEQSVCIICEGKNNQIKLQRNLLTKVQPYVRF